MGTTLTLSDVTEALDSANIDHITVTFYGGGDSGGIEYTDAQSSGKDVSAQLKDLTHCGQRVLLALEDLAYDDVNASGVDWYNNDGGKCHWALYKENDAWRVSLEVHQYYTEASLEHESDMLVSEHTTKDDK